MLKSNPLLYQRCRKNNLSYTENAEKTPSPIPIRCNMQVSPRENNDLQTCHLTELIPLTLHPIPPM